MSSGGHPGALTWKRLSRPPSAPATGYSSWPRRDGRKLVPRVNRVRGVNLNSVVESSEPLITAQPRCGLLRALMQPGSPSRDHEAILSGQHRFYCGVDLHTRTVSLCVLDSSGAIVCETTLPIVLDFLYAEGVESHSPGSLCAPWVTTAHRTNPERVGLMCSTTRLRSTRLIQPFQGCNGSASGPRVRCATLGYGMQRLRRKNRACELRELPAAPIGRACDGVGRTTSAVSRLCGKGDASEGESPADGTEEISGASETLAVSAAGRCGRPTRGIVFGPTAQPEQSPQMGTAPACRLPAPGLLAVQTSIQDLRVSALPHAS